VKVFFIVLTVPLLILRLWVEAAIFFVTAFFTFGIAINIHWDDKIRGFPKDYHKDDLSGMDPQLATFRFVKAVSSYCLLIGIVTAVLLIRFGEEWHYVLLGGFTSTLAAGVISALVSIRPWPR